MSPNGDAVIEPCGSRALAHYPHARLAPATTIRTLYVSGKSCRLPDGPFAGFKDNGDRTSCFDIREQTLATLRNIEATIKHASSGRSGLESIIDATVFLSDIQTHYSVMNEVWNLVYADAGSAPARTTIGVKGASKPELIVEIKCTALIAVEN